ncbi:beta-ketoacyl synthase N-terminal-like domain-containing protein [Streptomyces sp. NPDC017405]|uniref:beta-ketoacyl synthase N-terminal-like domain-containing protein n=1 Tax=unclassified Streptomyces TaxID=2593676 RepID=UPI0037BC3675
MSGTADALRPDAHPRVPDRDDLLSRSLEAIRSLRGELARERARAAEPIAVTGLACRFPGGADSPERFWEVLAEGRDAVGPAPADRWPTGPGSAGSGSAGSGSAGSGSAGAGRAGARRPGAGRAALQGGFLAEDIDAFDASFFGVSAGEAAAMDPQHKLLLETVWEALERAGLLTGRPGAGRVGVFVGVSGSDHARLPVRAERVGAFTAVGAAPSMAAGRVAHALGLDGPALAVDTACSSSLVAVHLAVESLRRGECDAAVAGGVNVLLSPDVFLVLDEMGALSPDGRCKVFDASADGYARAEGCGAVALTRLSDAVAARLPVHAVIRASAVNHDGGSGGLTVPNGRAQRALLRAALAGAGVPGEAVGYLETHGTGTPLGDPVEVGAAVDVLCARRSADRPLRLGALKSNLGHLEAAAGIAGLIKTVLVLRYGLIPPNLHLREPNPRLGVERLPVVLPRRTEPWPADGTPRIAGVSAFGFSGTNAHVIVEGADTAAAAVSAPVPPPVRTGAMPAAETVSGPVPPPVRASAMPAAAVAPDPVPPRVRTGAMPAAARVVPLSAASPAALAALARRTAGWVRDHPDARLADIAHTLGAHRRHFRHRAALVTDREGPDLAALLTEVADRADLVDRTDRTYGTARAGETDRLDRVAQTDHADLGDLAERTGHTDRTDLANRADGAYVTRETALPSGTTGTEGTDRPGRSNLTNPADRADRTGLTDAPDRPHRADLPHRTVRTDRSDPADLANRADGTDRADRADRAERTDRTCPADRTHETDQPDLAHPADPAHHAGPYGSPVRGGNSSPYAPHIGLFLDATPRQALAAARALRRAHGGFTALSDSCAGRLGLPAGTVPARLPDSVDALTPLAADAVALVFQTALGRLLADWGVPVAAVGGSGCGDLAAAVVAGTLDLAAAGALLTARHGGPVPREVSARPPAVRLLRGDGAEPVPPDLLADPGFWCGPAAGPARAASATAAPLAERGYGLFVSVGGPTPVPVPGRSWWRVAGDEHGDGVWGELLAGLAAAYRAGVVDPDWTRVHDDRAAVCLPLPAYPFQRRRHAPPVPRAEAHRTDGPAGAAARPLGGATALRVLSSPLEHAQFRTTLSREVLPQAADTGGVLHVGYYQEMVAAAVAELDGTAGHELRDAEFVHPLYLGARARTVQLTVSPETAGGGRLCTVHSQAEGETAWTLHLTSRLGARRPAPDPAAHSCGPEDRAKILARLPGRVDGAGLYAALRARGLALGPSVEWIEEAWYGDGEVVARLRAPERAGTGGEEDGVLPVPAGVFDACAQLYVPAAGSGLADDEVFLTRRIGRFALSGRPGRGPLWVRFVLGGEPSDAALTADYRLWDDAGHLVAACDGATVRRVGAGLTGPWRPAPEERSGPRRSTTAEQPRPYQSAAEEPGPNQSAAAEEAGPWRSAAEEASARRADVVERYRAAPDGLRSRVLGDYLRAVLDLSDDPGPAGAPPDRPLADLGVDSLRALELRGRLRGDLGVEPPLDALLHGTAAGLAAALGGLLLADAPAGPGRPVSREPARWLRHARLTDTARLRLFCLPYGGRGASLFRTWPDALPDDLDVCPVQLPGREDRADERCLEDPDALLDALEPVVRAHADRPFAFYGHSVGALLAYRLAHRLAPTHGDRLRHLFVAAFSCPAAGADPLLGRVTDACRDLGLPDLPTAGEVLRVRRARPAAFHGALAGRLGKDTAERLFGAAEPALFADLRLVRGYRHDPAEPRLRVPVTALHGAGDPVVAEADMRAWGRVTDGRFRLDVLPGDHYFCHPDQSLDRVLRLITEHLR